MSDDLHCDTCDCAVAREEATRSETCADLNPKRCQALWCPDCGRKLKTVFVDEDELE